MTIGLNKKIPQPSKAHQIKFYCLIGQVALMHAGIEQDIKNVLIEDWKVPEYVAEKWYGSALRNKFLETIKEYRISKSYYDAYSVIITRFKNASKIRNDVLKATYGYLEPAGEIFRYDLKLQRTVELEKRFNRGQKEEWMKVVTFEELENLKTELSQVREIFFQLTKRIYLENRQSKYYEGNSSN